MELNTYELKDYLKWKLKKISNLHENAWFWVSLSAIGASYNFRLGNVQLFVLNILVLIFSGIYIDFKSGRWRGEMREYDKKRAIEIIEKQREDMENGKTSGQ